jgi:hypothetical protein
VTGTTAVYTPSSGMLFVVYMASLSTIATNNQTLTFESGATEIYRKLILSTGAVVPTTRETPFTVVTGMPYFIGLAADDVFNVSITANFNIAGTFLVGEVPPDGV